MKKILILIGMLAMINSTLLADVSRRVSNSPNRNVATLEESRVQVLGDGSMWIIVKLSEKTEHGGDIEIFVEIRNLNGKLYDTKRIVIRAGRSEAHINFSDYRLNIGDWYNLSIVDARYVKW